MYTDNLGCHENYKLGRLASKRLKDFYALAEYPTFVETGTSIGNGVAWALEQKFRSIYSVEIQPHSYRQSSDRFRKEPTVMIVNDDTASFLKKLLPNLQGPVIFYLDAHWSGGATGKVENDPVPLLAESKILLQYKDIDDCLIIVDDERLMVDPVNPPATWGATVKSDLVALWHGIGFSSTYLDDSIIFEKGSQ